MHAALPEHALRISLRFFRFRTRPFLHYITLHSLRAGGVNPAGRTSSPPGGTSRGSGRRGGGEGSAAALAGPAGAVAAPTVEVRFVALAQLGAPAAAPECGAFC